MEKLRIGTRRSKLALAQTNLVVAALHHHYPQLPIEVVEISTVGDRKQGTALAGESDKKEWILDLELALVEQSIDLAIHSGKDVPIDLEPGTVVHSLLKRADARDAFIGRFDSALNRRLRFDELPPDAKIGTSSPRRCAFLLRAKPDVEIRSHRGNVTTRVQKLDSSPDLHGVILAQAGLSRLGYSDLNEEQIPTGVMLPALNQGSLAVQYLERSSLLAPMLAKLIDLASEAEFAAERRCAEVLSGDCRSSFGIYAEASADKLTLWANVLSFDGKESVSGMRSGTLNEALEIGSFLGDELLQNGAGRIIAECSRKPL